MSYTDVKHRYWNIALVLMMLLGTFISYPASARSLDAPSEQTATWLVLSNGDKGVQVKAAQHLLTSRGHWTSADGKFGPKTERSVKSFQREFRLTVNGVITSNNWEYLTRTVRPGSKGSAVKAVQVLLNAKANARLKVDGDFGPKTKAAVKKFQRSKGIADDGVVRRTTWLHLVTRR